MTLATAILLLVLSVVFVSCNDYTEPVLPVIDYRLMIVDSIGVEDGDSNCIIGLPVKVSFTPDGNVAVLDRMKHGIYIYSIQGEFITKIGREGEGPGEFIRPSGFSFYPDGELLVSDLNSITFFDSSLTYIDRISPDPGVGVITALNDRSFFGSSRQLETDEDELSFVYSYGRWNGEIEQLVEFYTTSVSASTIVPPEDGKIHESDSRIYSCVSAATGRGFFAESSREEFSIVGFESDGTQFLHIQDNDFQRVRKSKAEIQFEADKMNSIWSTVFGSTTSSNFEYVPNPYKPAISGMFVDHEERLWVQLGYYSRMVFRVYDMNGIILFHAMLDFPGEEINFNSWKVTGDGYGFLGFDRRPVDAVRVYIMELQEN